MSIPHDDEATFYWLDAPSIYDDTIIFWGADDNNEHVGVYGWFDEQLVKVITEGDLLDGKTISSLWFDPN